MFGTQPIKCIWAPQNTCPQRGFPQGRPKRVNKVELSFIEKSVKRALDGKEKASLYFLAPISSEDLTNKPEE